MFKITLLKSTGAEGSQAEELPSLPESIQTQNVLWIDAESPTEKELETLRERFNLDQYAVEDVTHESQRPKIEEYKDHIFSVIHIPVEKKDDDKKSFGIVELFVFFQERWLITIHKEDAEIIHTVDKRVRSRGLAPLSKIPSADLLYYVFLDFSVDAYFQVLDIIENELEELDDRSVVLLKTRRKSLDSVGTTMTLVGSIRAQLNDLRKALAPTRDILGMIMRGAVPFIADSSLRSFRDIYDHSFQLIETIDTYRDRTSDVRDLYISLLTASTDNIIKLLTVVATILLPLSLLTSIYGMNFTQGFFEPGSGSAYGFYALILAMLAIAGALLYAFRRAGWI